MEKVVQTQPADGAESHSTDQVESNPFPSQEGCPPRPPFDFAFLCMLVVRQIKNRVSLSRHQKLVKSPRGYIFDRWYKLTL